MISLPQCSERVSRSRRKEEIVKFLERHQLPKLTPEQINNLTTPPSVTETESIVIKRPTKTAPDSDCLPSEL